MRWWWAVAVTAGLATALHPGRALACPVCFSGNQDTLAAFYGTAILLSLLPLALVGSIGVWFRRRARVREEEDRRRRAGTADLTSPSVEG